MDFGKLIHSSFDTVKKRRYLWWLGILSAITESGYSQIYQYNLNDNQLQNKSEGFDSEGNILGAATTWFASGGWQIMVVIGIILVFSLLIIYLSYSSKAGLIKSVARIDEGKEEWGFKEAFRSGRKYAFRLFGFSALYLLSIILLLTIFAIPAVYLFLAHQTFATVGAIILSVVGLVSIIVLALYVSITVPLVERVIVLKNERIIQAISSAYKIFRLNLVQVVLTYLINAGLSIGYAIIVGTATMIVAGVLFGVGYGLYRVNDTLAIVYGIPVGVALMMVLIGVTGFFTAFISSYWTLAFRQLNRGSSE